MAGNREHLMRLGLVVAGGTLGSAGRWAVGNLIGEAPDTWPWATLTVNLTGAFLLGLMVNGLGRFGSDDGWRRSARLGLGTGILGGFTTYSTFAAQVARLVGIGDIGLGLGYAAVTVVGGVIAAAAGMALGRRR